MTHREHGALRALNAALVVVILLLVGVCTHLVITDPWGAPSGAPQAPPSRSSPTTPAGRHSPQGSEREATPSFPTGTPRASKALTLKEVQLLAFDHARARGVDSLLVLGVILTENPWLLPDTVSRHGSVGLMQVTPRFWLGSFPECGDDLTDPNTNICYGTAILSLLLIQSSGDRREALLRYNGCRGVWLEKYPTCLDYPDMVTERGKL